MASEMSVGDYEAVRRLIRPAVRSYVRRYTLQRREDLNDLLTSEVLMYFWREYQKSTEDQSFVVWSAANIRMADSVVRVNSINATKGYRLHGYRVAKTPGQQVAERQYTQDRRATMPPDTGYDLTELLGTLSSEDRRVAEHIVSGGPKGLGRRSGIAGSLARIARALEGGR